MNKEQVKDYIIKEFIPKIEKEIEQNNIYQDVIDCVLKILDYYGQYIAHERIIYGEHDEETILLTLERMIFYQQIEQEENICMDYVNNVYKGLFEYNEETLKEDNLTPQDIYNMCDSDGFQPTYNSITSMWNTYNSSHDIFDAIDSALNPFINNYTNEFRIYKKGTIIYHGDKEELEEKTEKLYNMNNYIEFIKNFNKIFKYMNDADFEENETLGILYFISTNYNISIDYQKLKQLEVLNEMIKIIDNNS